ncbi:MAG: type II toxin-antitoxin system Phd/YefM family antitoxin [Carbonactinosporaceae bacterium]
MTASVERIGVRELRQHASRYIDLVEAGATIEVTKRGRPVARLVPVEQPDNRVAELIAQGVLRPAARPGGLSDIVPLTPEPGAPSVSEELRRMRDEERW